MSKTLTALVVGVVLGVAGSWLSAGGSEEGPEALPAPAEVVAVPLPDLPEPYYTVLYENDAVRIVDHQLGVGESEPEHTHAPMVGYFVEGATILITEADGSTSEPSIPTGAFLSDDPRWWTHSLENTGDTPLHSILIEFKAPPPGN